MSRKIQKIHFIIFTSILCYLLPSPSASALSAWKTFVISSHSDYEALPRIHGNFVVWETYVSQYGDWDVLGAEISVPEDPLVFAIGNSAQDEMSPDIWGNIVVYEIKFNNVEDHDIYAAILKPTGIEQFSVDSTPIHSSRPRIWGQRLAWNDYYTSTGDWDPALVDIADLNEPRFISIEPTLDDEYGVDLSEDLLVWNQFDRDFDNSVWGSALWTAPPTTFYTNVWVDPNSVPAVDGDWVAGIDSEGWVVADNLFDPIIPQRISNSNFAWAVDMAEHIIVWEDYRNGDADLYGYNLYTQTEFVITSAVGDQINPAITPCPDREGFWVIWEDRRLDPDSGDIYGMWLNGPKVAGLEL